MANKWAWISAGGAVCLLGFAFWFRSRKLSSPPSSESSEAIQQALSDLKHWKENYETHLETLFDRVRSVAGRIDRAKRKADPEGSAQEEGSPGGSPEAMDQSTLNRLAARHMGLAS